MNETKIRTDFLLPRFSFITGAGTIFNIGGNFFEFNTSKSEIEADYKAIKSDWDMVGEDVSESLKDILLKNNG